MTTTEFEIKDFGQPYHDAVIKFKSIWPNYRKVTRELAEPVNQMVDIIFEIHPDWSIRRSLNQIAADLGDLTEGGFSVRHLYRFLNDKNRNRIQNKSLTYDTTKLLETDKEVSSRLEKERQENEESAKNVSRIYGIDNTKENPLELKGHSHCLEKQQRLLEELDAIKGQMMHYKQFFERGEVILEPEVLKEIGKLQRSNPDQLIITHERMHALDARTK